MAWGEGEGFTGGYDKAIQTAAEAQAREAKMEAQRKAKDNPLYKIGQILQPIGSVVDIGLSAAGLPPIAGASAKGLKSLAGAAAGVEGETVAGGAGGLGEAAAAFMKWKAVEDAKKKQKGTIDKMMKLIEGSKPAAPAGAKKPVSTSDMSLEELIESYSDHFATTRART